MSDLLHVVLVDDDLQIVKTVKRLLRHLPVVVVDLDDARTAIAYLSTTNAPVDIVWTDLGFPEGAVGLAILELAARRSPRPDLLLVSGGDLSQVRVPAGTRMFAKLDLRAPVDAIERLVGQRLPRE
jgi:DNA-binding NtrC family response regulator